MKPLTLRLTPSRKPEASPPLPDLDLRFDVCAWDDWERFALARGLDAQTAGLGRLLIREAYNHGWESWLQSLCGWQDDGLRGDIHPDTKEWTWGYLRVDMRGVLSTLHRYAQPSTINSPPRHAANP